MTQKEFQEWKGLPQTEAFFGYISRKRSELIEGWARGAFTHDSIEGTAQLNAKALGSVEILDGILSVDEDSFDE